MTSANISRETRDKVRRDAKNRCGYCLSAQQYIMARLEIDHIVPRSKGGADDEENLWLACPICNGHKSDKVDAVDDETKQMVGLFNPRTQDWFEHFKWSDDGIFVIGLTPTGRATVKALHLDSFWCETLAKLRIFEIPETASVYKSP